VAAFPLGLIATIRVYKIILLIEILDAEVFINKVFEMLVSVLLLLFIYLFIIIIIITFILVSYTCTPWILNQRPYSPSHY